MYEGKKEHCRTQVKKKNLILQHRQQHLSSQYILSKFANVKCFSKSDFLKICNFSLWNPKARQGPAPGRAACPSTQLQKQGVDACLPQVKLSLQSFFAIWNWKHQSINLAVFLELQPKSTGQKLCYFFFFPLFLIAILLKIQSSSSSLIAHFETIQTSRSPALLRVWNNFDVFLASMLRATFSKIYPGSVSSYANNWAFII